LERVLACRRHDLSVLWPFEIAGVRHGWVRPALAQELATPQGPFQRRGERLVLAADLDTPRARTAAVESRLRALVDAGRLVGWRGESYAVVTRFGAPEAMRLERAAAPWLGVRAFGVHVNGWVRGPRGPQLWVALRSRSKPTHPGKLDHLVAGGQPAGLGLRENLAKEAMEEAAVPAELAARAVAVAPFRYRLLSPEGLRDDTLFVYDLELPADFVPRPLDGEVEQFRLVPADEVAERLRSSDDFKYNVGPCILGFLLRHDVLGPRDPERAALISELGSAVLEPSVPEPQDDVP
jgi:hypothetical protein